MSNRKKRVQSNRSKRNRKRKQRARSKKLYKRRHKSRGKQHNAQVIDEKVDKSQQAIKQYNKPMRKSFFKRHIKSIFLLSYIIDIIITFLITLIIHYKIPNLNYEIGRICGSIFTLFTIILSSVWFSYWCYYINEQINNSNVRHAKAIKIVNNISNVYSSLTALFSYYMYTNRSDILPSMSNVLNKCVDPILSIISVILLLIPSVIYSILKFNKRRSL